ncbi:maleylpyruvate isomerase N-terminal domain-containing protein [Streptomyces sp. NPDC049040]|uniref:maleylpyruvate isomerase N-terminal domain-containing protein n=1 Tax=Streptomyces sp. NPDC049040 TaxID=3365593 RepID=UPI003716ADAF
MISLTSPDGGCPSQHVASTSTTFSSSSVSTSSEDRKTPVPGSPGFTRALPLQRGGPGDRPRRAGRRPLTACPGLDQGRVLEAFRLEAGELSGAVTGLSASGWDRPTRCAPWSVRELPGHVRVVIAWLPQMPDAPAPDKAEVSAAEYHRPDGRFSPGTNAARIDLARDQAAGHAGGAALAADFTASVWIGCAAKNRMTGSCAAVMATRCCCRSSCSPGWWRSRSTDWTWRTR